jgi:hypothetical protein
MSEGHSDSVLLRKGTVESLGWHSVQSIRISNRRHGSKLRSDDCHDPEQFNLLLQKCPVMPTSTLHDLARPAPTDTLQYGLFN